VVCFNCRVIGREARPVLLVDSGFLLKPTIRHKAVFNAW
jgi:hypothetical protein